MENIIENVKWGQGTETTGFRLARQIANKHQEKTGNRCIVRRIVDYVDQFNGRDREHFSFDVIEMV